MVLLLLRLVVFIAVELMRPGAIAVAVVVRVCSVAHAIGFRVVAVVPILSEATWGGGKEAFSKDRVGVVPM